MDTAYLRELLVAVKHEFIRFKGYVVGLFVLVSFSVLGVGLIWPNTYETSSLLYVDATTIIEPLLKGRAEVTGLDLTKKAVEMVGTRRIMEIAAERLGMYSEGDSPERKEAAIVGLRRSFEVEDEKNNYFRITFYSNDPFFSYEGINTVVDVLIEESNRQKEEESRSAYSFIDEQVATYKAQLEAAEEKLKEFKSSNIDGTEEEVSRKITQLRTDIEDVTLSIEETRERLQTTKSQLAQEEHYQRTLGQIEGYKARRQALVDELERLRLSYQETYPDIVSIKTQIQELDDTIVKQQLGDKDGLYARDENNLENPLREELRRQLSAAEVDLKTQRKRKTSLEKLLEKEYDRAEKIVANQAQLAELTRDYDVTREVYEEMLQRKESARLSVTIDEKGQGVSYKVRQPAVFPLSPSGITFVHFAFAGPVLALIFPLGLLFLYVNLDPRLRSPQGLISSLPKDYELLGTIPHFNTPLGERVVRKDVVVLGLTVFVSLAVYVVLTALRFAEYI